MWKRTELLLLVAICRAVIFLPATQAWDLNELTPELMTPVFNLMRTDGERLRDKITSGWDLREGVDNQQFLLTVVMSRDEVEEISRDGRFPDAFFREINDGDDYTRVWHRVLFQLNKVKGVDKALYGKSRRHTEVAAIDLGYLDQALERFGEDHGDDKYPLIVMYSHYIPCTGVPQLGYSCAQEIKNYAIHRHQDLGFIVAFTEVFPKTDDMCSRQFLREGGVPLFQYNSGVDGRPYYDVIERFVPPDPPAAQDEGTLQGYLYDAVIRVVAASRQCCMGDANNTQRIVAFFVNEVTFRCTYQSHKARRVTKGGQFQLYKCLSPFAKDLGNDCATCKERYKRPQIFINKLDKALCNALQEAEEDFVLAGKPPSSNYLSIYSPNWQPFDGPWSGLYTRAPSVEASSLPAVECADRQLSKISLCTKFKAHTDTFSSTDDLVQLRPGVQQAPQQLQIVREGDAGPADISLRRTWPPDENSPLLDRHESSGFWQKFMDACCCCRR